MTEEWVVSFHVTGDEKTAERWRRMALRLLDSTPDFKPAEDDRGAYCSGHVTKKEAA